MLAIAQAKNNAVNTAEDSVSPQRYVPHLAKQGQAQQQMRIDSASKRAAEDIVKLTKLQNGKAMTGSGLQSSKQRGRPSYAGGAADPSNFTGLYSNNDLTSA